MLIIATYIDFIVQQINFINKDFLDTKDLMENSKIDLSDLPCIDSHIKELYDCKAKNNLFDKPQSIFQFNGYKISNENIQLIRKFLDKKVNVEIQHWYLTDISDLINQWINDSKNQENQRQISLTEQKNAIPNILVKKIKRK